jgi:PTS system fructose-specific IIB component
MEQFIAIPHGKSGAVKEAGIAFWRSKEGFQYHTSLGGGLAKLVFYWLFQTDYRLILIWLSWHGWQAFWSMRNFEIIYIMQKPIKMYWKQLSVVSVCWRNLLEVVLQEGDIMKIVAITACAGGIAHTYMAAEALKKCAREAGDEITIEIQGSLGIENKLTPEAIKKAELVIFAVIIHVEQWERFEGKNPIIIDPGEFVANGAKALLEAKKEAGY